MSSTTDINVCYCIALIAPVSRIRAFKFCKFGYCVWRNTHDLPFTHSITRSLTKPAPGNNTWNLFSQILRKEQVGIDLASVSHNYFHILMADNARCGFISSLVKCRTETLAHARHRICGLGKVDLVLIIYRLSGNSVDRFNFFTLKNFFFCDESCFFCHI